MTEPPEHIRIFYVVGAAMAGSIVALSQAKWREMTWPDIAMTLFVSFSFAIILVPWAANALFGIKSDGTQALCALVFVGGMSSNALMPLVIKKVKKLFGAEEPA
jgi:hypothetical protein